MTVAGGSEVNGLLVMQESATVTGRRYSLAFFAIASALR